MIRLIDLNQIPPQSQAITKQASPVRPSQKNSSPEIRLGRHRKRATTLTAQADNKMETDFTQKPLQKSNHLSFFTHDVIPLEIGRSENKMKRTKLQLESSRYSLAPESLAAMTSLSDIQKGLNEAKTKEACSCRQIVKLKHRKMRSFSPIDKLAPLLMHQTQTQPQVVNI